MTDTFERFVRAFGPAASARVPSRAEREAYAGRLPARLLELWARVGWGPLGSGAFWLEDPRTLADPLAAWLEEPASAVGFARSSFGCLYCWQDEEVTLVDVHEGAAFSVDSNVDAFFGDYLLSPEAHLDDLRLPLHEAALARLGPLLPTEMYAFLPALVLGGDEDVAHVERMPMREHLALLAALHGG